MEKAEVSTYVIEIEESSSFSFVSITLKWKQHKKDKSGIKSDCL